MNEDFLHYVWKYQLFSKQHLQSTEKEEIHVLKTGFHNKNAGPDFKNAQIKIGTQFWAGHVELHIKASDWFVHHHEIDANYDTVILHVVWEDDVTVFMKNNAALPTLVLKDIVLDSAIKNYQNLFSKQLRWIACEQEITTIDAFTIENWKERLFFERLERKSTAMNLLLEANKNDFEATLFQLLAKNFGLKINGDAFLSLAASIDFAVLRKLRFDATTLAALFFGQAGFLDEVIENEYHLQLKQEYAFLKHKYNLKELRKEQFSFFRMRPSNFPTIRLAQLVSLYHQNQNLFSKLMHIKDLDGFYNAFEIVIHPFWETHYTFRKESKKASKKLTKSFVDLLLINTIIPLKFLYEKNKGILNEDEILNIIKKIKPEKNSIISKFKELKITANAAFETQSLLELKNNYCDKKLCLQCAVGIKILKGN